MKDLDLNLADLRAMAHRTLIVKEKDDKPVTYRGVTIEDVLAKAGMNLGAALRGTKMRDYLLAEGADGYGVVFALPELAAEYSDRVVMVADAANDKSLGEKEGPLKIVVSDEKKHARWVRNLTTLTVRTSSEPKP